MLVWSGVIVFGSLAASSGISLFMSPGRYTNLAVGFFVISVLTAALLERFGIRPAVVCQNGGMLVRNPFSTHLVPWEDVEAIRLSDHGLVVLLKDGGAVRAWALQKSRLAIAINRRSRGDISTEYLANRVAAAQGRDGSQILPSGEARATDAKNARIGLVVGLCFLTVLVVFKLR